VYLSVIFPVSDEFWENNKADGNSKSKGKRYFMNLFLGKYC